MCCVSWHIQISGNYPNYENLMVAFCVCTRHIPPYTTIYRHMTVYAGICRDIRVSGFQMISIVFSRANYVHWHYGMIMRIFLLLFELFFVLLL
jgi:hypothetical protein